MEKDKLAKQIENAKAECLTGLFGSPIGHSMSPFLHNAAYKQLGMKGYKYIAMEANEKFLPEAVELIKEYNFRGFNLTMPDKEVMVGLCDKITTEANLMKSVNTVKIENGKLVGYNTDCHGFFAALSHNGFEYKDKNMVLLGSGGAARSILAGGAFNEVKKIEIFARPSEKYDILCEFVQRLRSRDYQTEIVVNDLADKEYMYDVIRQSDLLVNSTSVGMDCGNGTDETLIENTACLHNNLFVADVIYFPRMTRLLMDAKEAGCNYMNGLGMLFFQAALAFEIWHGLEMPIEILGKTE